MPRKQFLTIVVGKDKHGRKLSNVCPKCKQRLSEGFFFLKLLEMTPAESLLGAMGPDIPIAPVCCGVAIDYVQLHATEEEARDRSKRLLEREPGKLRFIRVSPPSALVPVV